MKIQPTKWGKGSVNHAPDKGLISETQKELIQLTNKQHQITQSKNGQRTRIDIYLKKTHGRPAGRTWGRGAATRERGAEPGAPVTEHARRVETRRRAAQARGCGLGGSGVRGAPEKSGQTYHVTQRLRSRVFIRRKGEHELGEDSAPAAATLTAGGGSLGVRRWTGG